MRNNDVTCAILDVQYGCDFYSHRNRFDISLSYMYIKISGLWVWIPLTGLTSPHVCAWIQHGLVAIPAETYLVPGDTRTRGEHKFRPPNVRNDVYKYSFFPRTIHWWLEQTTSTRHLCHLIRRFQEPAGHTHRVPAGSPDNVNIQQSRFYFNCTCT
jgi:hypothetical protein